MVEEIQKILYAFFSSALPLGYVIHFGLLIAPEIEFSFFKDYIARFGHGSAKLARQAQSKEKTLAKMIEGGLTEKVTEEKVCIITML